MSDNETYFNLKHRIAELESKLAAANAETAACISFLQSQLGWENFWGEGWTGRDVEGVSRAEQNASALRSFLLEKGHGVDFMKELAAAKAKFGLAEKMMVEQAAMIEGQNKVRGVLIGRIASLEQEKEHEIQRSNQLARESKAAEKRTAEILAKWMNGDLPSEELFIELARALAVKELETKG